MTAQLGQSVVIENRPGAAGSIAAGELAKSAPDGYRLLMVASGTFIHDVLSANMSYSLERDFAPISLVTISPLVLVIHPSLPARSVNDLVVFARSRPVQLRLAVRSIKRSSLAPSLPTLDESGLRGYNLIAWFGVLAPAGTPKSIVDRLNAVIANVAGSPDAKETVGKQGLEIEISSPEQFAAFMRESVTQISRLGKEANIKLE